MKKFGKGLVFSSIALVLMTSHAYAQSSVTLSGTVYAGLGLNSGGGRGSNTGSPRFQCNK